MTQTPMTAGTRFARSFAAHRGALLDLYATLPEEHAGFRAWEGGMSFIGLADHLSGAASRFLDMIAGQTPAPAPQSVTLDEARGRLQATLDSATTAMSAMTEDDLARRVPAFGGRELPVAALLEMITVHEAHHKGQVWMMARMVGLTPPMFVKMG